ncbi:MAG: type II toxin-antitoxin system HicB family antitoxin [Desulfobacca sp.]|nr:type II toxin-antitoxin system HicB family antitoxin [Desulfobacca sp.]
MPRYTLVYWQDADWLVGRLRERPDVFSQGRSMPELEENIKEALSLMEETDFLDLPPNYQVKELLVETG